MPSQFFENWCYNKDFLSKISKHYKTNEHLPLNIIENIKRNRKFQNGINYLTQILYIKYDMKIHKKKNITEKELYELWFKIEDQLLDFKMTKNIYPMCRFDHLMSYSVGYYGYLWSLIYSHQAFSLFERDGVFNNKLGIKFRKEILEKGGTLKGTVMLKNFMGKNLNNDILQFF
jgi:Zn-dependent oligopeptidase